MENNSIIKLILALIIICLIGHRSVAQDYLISTSDGDTIAACNGNFYDSGSNIGDYSNNEKYSVTFNAPTNQRIIFNFTSLKLVAAGGDTLRIFDGADTLSTIIGTYAGIEESPFTVQSTDSALTFQFTSDGSLVNEGWEATITCCSIPETSGITGLNTECVNSAGVSYSVIDSPGSTYEWFITGGVQASGADTNSIIVDWSDTSGSASVKVIEDNGCTLGDTVALNVALNALPIVNFSGLNPEYDLNLDGVQTLTGSPVGGVFSGSGISGNTFNPLAAGLGVHEIVYEYTDENSCVNSDTLDTEVKDYDFIAGARTLTDLDNWYSGDAIYTTLGATADGNIGDCWNSGNNHTRWFKFQATTTQIAATFLTGDSYGTARTLNAAIWEADGTTQVDCNRYTNFYDSVTVQSPNIVLGDWYYISVTTLTGGYRGTFSLRVNEQVDYDYYEGAIELTDLDNWYSGDAIYTTLGATADGNIGDCWNSGNNHTRWFKFQATTTQIAATFLTGDSYGTARTLNAAIWEADGTTQVDCNRYTNFYDSVTVQSPNIVPGNWYYISVTTLTGGYRGTFSLRVNEQVDYDYYEGAIELSDITNWDSPDAAYTTLGGTPDKSAASCWDTDPNYNRWFKFQATTSTISILVRRGGSYGTIRRINAAIWEADGTTEVSCNRYISNDDNVYVESVNLIPGDWYYLSVDSYAGYYGTFSLRLNTRVTYDYKDGAFEVQDLNNWCSSDAQFSNVGATSDLNAASCWNTTPNNNVWFKFQATTHKINVEVKRGGLFGSIRRVNVAIWENDATTQLSCNRYVNNDDNVSVGTDKLIPGNTYYISVDSYLGYYGTFSLCVDEQMDYDYLGGAKDITPLINSCSADAEYTTIGATADESPAPCWNTLPNNNRWFKFMATTAAINVQVKRGGSYGTIRRVNLALYDKDTTTILDCNRYTYDADNVEVAYEGLIPGEWYFISVDNYAGYYGSFTLCLDDKPSYDYYEGAIELGIIDDWSSTDAAYTTAGATPDKNRGTCWNTGPSNNRWFKFTATSSQIHIEIRRGGVYGTVRRVNAAIWEDDGETEIVCKRYVFNDDIVEVEATDLIPGDTYYLSVDNYPGYYGTFSLYVDDEVNYDYYEGAKDISHLINLQSADAEYTTVGATPDKNKGSCWNANPNNNRWFKFQATTPGINIEVLRGGSYGTIRRVNMSLYESDGITELKCERYVNDNDIVDLNYEGLTPGNWYYVSVDNYAGYFGAFTLKLNDQVSYDYYEGAIELTDIHNWSSADAAYTTIGATPDKNAASCWNTAPNYNRWFKFIATTPVIDIEIKRGGSLGTIRRTNAAIWESDGTTQLACNRYVSDNDNVSVGYNSLTPGNEYYISIDCYAGYYGTFSLFVSDEMDYDFYEGAYEISDLNNWQSADAQFTTIGATRDKNAASCWNTSPNYNRWFKFQAISPNLSVQALRGGSFGTARRINLALWEADGTTQKACSRYVADIDNVFLTSATVTPGSWYYISVDCYSGYYGTFTLQVSNVSGNEYYAITDGDWGSAATWSLSEGGPPAVSSPGSGDVVHIKGFDVTVSGSETCAELGIQVENDQTSLAIDGGALTVYGSLNFDNNGFNYDGTINILNSGNLEVRDDFIMNRSGGGNIFRLLVQDNSSLIIQKNMSILSSAGNTVNNEFTVSGSATAQINKDLTLENTGGIKSIVALNNFAELTVKRDIYFISPAEDKVELELNNDSKLHPGKSIQREADRYGILDCKDNSTIVFSSSDYLQIIPENNGAGSDNFSYQNIEVNNTRLSIPQLSLEGHVKVPGVLTLLKGVIQTTATNLLTIENTGLISGGSASSYIEGPLEITGNSAVTFPLGKNGRYQPIAISAPSVDTDAFLAEYFDANPNASYDTNLHEASIDQIADCEYWTLQRSSGTSSVNVTAYWDGNGCCISDMASLKLAVWDGTEWKNYGNGGTNGTSSSGDITSLNVVDFNTCALTFADHLPIVDFTDPGGPYCESAAAIMLTGSPMDANGLFAGNGITDNGDGTAQFSPNTVGKGTHQIIYNYIAASGCSNSVSKNVTVNPKPTATILGTDTVCIGTSNEFSIYLTGSAPWDLTYSDGTNTYNVVTSENPYKFVANVAATYSVTALTDATGCFGTYFGNTAKLVNWPKPPKPTTSVISGSPTFCEGDNLILEATAATLYYWNNGISTQQNTITNPGDFWVKIVDEHGCFSDNSDITTVTVNKTARKPSAIAGDDALCQENPNTAYSTKSWYADAYNWNLQPAEAGTIIGTGSNIEINWEVSYAGVAKLSVYGSNVNCGDGPTSDTLYISLGAFPDNPGPISGNQLVCQGQSGVEYSISPVLNASSYNWTLPDNAVFYGASHGNTVTVDYLDNAIPGNITVQALNPCGTSFTTSVLPIDIQLISHSPTGITKSDDNISPGDPVTLTVQGGSLGEAAVWKWYLDAFGTTSAGYDGSTLDVNPMVTTQYWVRAEGACNITSMATTTVTINPLPLKPGTPTGATTLCQNSPNTDYSTSGATGANSYIWEVSPVDAGIFSGTGTTGTIDWSNSWFGTANITVKGENGSGTGPASDPITVTIHKKPTTGAIYHIPNNWGF